MPNNSNKAPWRHFWYWPHLCLGGLLIVPVTAIIAVTVLAFGPILGFFYALLGMTASALLTFWMGHLLGRQWIRRLAASRLSQLSRRLAQKGVLAVVLIRLVPVAPFTIVNLVAGASHIRFRDFALGTVLGEVPGLLVLALFMDRVSETVRPPERDERNHAGRSRVILVYCRCQPLATPR